jgi:hypothetical protein
VPIKKKKIPPPHPKKEKEKERNLVLNHSTKFYAHVIGVLYMLLHCFARSLACIYNIFQIKSQAFTL